MCRTRPALHGRREQNDALERGGHTDAVRLVVRAVGYVVFGEFALFTITTVAGVLGPVLALDLYTPPVAAW